MASLICFKDLEEGLHMLEWGQAMNASLQSNEIQENFSFLDIFRPEKAGPGVSRFGC